MKKTIKEILIIGAAILILNVTGVFGEVLGFIQRGVLYTGFLNADVEESVSPSDAEFNFPLTSLEGQEISLEKYKGKVIFLNLWATWCGPCIAEMPGIQDLYDKVDKEKVVFVMVSLDDQQEKAERFIERKNFTFPVYMPYQGIPNVYRTGAIPTTHVISPEGKIVFSKKGTANYDTKKFRKFLEEQALTIK